MDTGNGVAPIARAHGLNLRAATYGQQGPGAEWWVDGDGRWMAMASQCTANAYLSTGEAVSVIKSVDYAELVGE